MMLSTLLEVFPGWPVAAQGAAMDWLMLLLIGPLAVGVVIAVLFNASRWLDRDRNRAPELEA